MKARTLLCGLALCTLGAVAQTEVSPYVPGATVEGVTYYLPRTALRLVVVLKSKSIPPENSANMLTAISVYPK